MSEIKVRRFSSADADFDSKLKALLAFETAQDDSIDEVVANILKDVKKRGDAAVLDYTNRFDKTNASKLAELEISQSELQAALNGLPAAQREALQTAADRVRSYHEKQLMASWQYTEADGTILGQQVTSLDRVGLYVPGGKAAYPSSVLMNAIPAKVAGVKDLIMVVPTPNGEKNALVLAAAAISGVDRVFCIRGAQAVGALAYGTETVPQVDKIVGPGNAYVAAAKRRVFGVVGIDMVAGPSEILVICDGKTNPDWVAMDLFSQAEHDVIAASVLVTDSTELADAVEAELIKRVPKTKHSERIATALSSQQSAIVLVDNVQQGLHIVNSYAAEHLEIQTRNAKLDAAQIRNAGAVFIGRYAPVSLGDYAAGSNHVLPTGGCACHSSGLSVQSFLRGIHLVEYSKEAFDGIASAVVTLANSEDLPAHGEAITARYEVEQ